jgi:hypothetical protein
MNNFTLLYRSYLHRIFQEFMGSQINHSKPQQKYSIYLQTLLKCTLQLRNVDTEVSLDVEHFHHALIVDIC